MSPVTATAGACAYLLLGGWEETAKAVRLCLEKRQISIHPFKNGPEGLEDLARAEPLVVFLAEELPESSGLEVLEKIRRLDSTIPVVVVLGTFKASKVVHAMSAGAFDCVTRHIECEDLDEIIDHAICLRSESYSERVNYFSAFGQEENQPCFLSSADSKVRHIKQLVDRIAASQIPVVITGESGVGKEVLARFIHSKSPRGEGPFVKVNCAALPTELLESELFGYERGAFTGASERKPGKFEAANGGSILLDEIGEFSLPLQPKLLHVLQDGEYTRLGGTRPIQVDARVLASTNRNLETAVALGEFRDDLFYRLNVVRIEIPPLRDRKQDIPVLCRYFVRKHSALNLSNRVRAIPKCLMDKFCEYSWPGNVRQLENAVKQFLVLGDEDLVAESLISLASASASQDQGVNLIGSSAPLQDSLKSLSAKVADEAELQLVKRTLDRLHWNRKQAARELRISYKSLLKKVHRWESAGRLKAS